MTIQRVPFLDVFEDESGGNIKTPQSEYLPVGKFPVVDQGKALIAGYVDDASRLCGDGRPAIVFGDHTRCVKYAGFPFCMGADGVKVLRPKVEADLKYLYYFLRQLDIPNAGYDRHFKYLKRTEVVLQPLPEQQRIAAILDQTDALRAKRREALEQLDSLTQSIFIEMFGNPVTNPKGWNSMNLKDFFNFTTGKLDSNAAVENGAYPFFTCAKEDSQIDTFAFDCEALLLAGNNASADYSVKHYKGKFNAYQRTYVITLKDERNSYEYSAFVLENLLLELKRMSKGSSTKYLTLELLNRIRIPIPDPKLQNQFATRLTATKKVRETLNQSLDEMNSLFDSMQHRAFGGEL